MKRTQEEIFKTSLDMIKPNVSNYLYFTDQEDVRAFKIDRKNNTLARTQAQGHVWQYLLV